MYFLIAAALVFLVIAAFCGDREGSTAFITWAYLFVVMSYLEEVRGYLVEIKNNVPAAMATLDNAPDNTSDNTP